MIDRHARLPVILSWVLVQAEQRHVLLERPLVRPAGSWRGLSLCVHLNLPGGKKQRLDKRVPLNNRDDPSIIIK